MEAFLPSISMKELAASKQAFTSGHQTKCSWNPKNERIHFLRRERNGIYIIDSPEDPETVQRRDAVRGAGNGVVGQNVVLSRRHQAARHAGGHRRRGHALQHVLREPALVGRLPAHRYGHCSEVHQEIEGTGRHGDGEQLGRAPEEGTNRAPGAGERKHSEPEPGGHQAT